MDTQELAQMMKVVLNDRLNNETREHLAFEAASLRAFLFSAIDRLDHLREHVERGEVLNTQMMEDALTRLIHRLQNNIANLDDVRDELKRLDGTHPHTDTQ
jgi:ABC-type phosphate transport system auxiliary subunit